MKPSQEYLNSIIKKLDALNSNSGNAPSGNTNREPDTYRLPSLMDQMGTTAQKYLDDKKKREAGEP